MTELLVLSLAGWRVASLLVNEDGPGAVFARLRYRAGLRYVVRQGAGGQPEAMRTATNWLAEGLTCVWCVSVWAVAGLLLLTHLGKLLGWQAWSDAVLLLLAASAGAALVETVVGKAR